MGLEIFTTPIPLLIVMGIVAFATFSHYHNDFFKPIIKPKRLVIGYLAILGCCALMAAVESYVPKSEAISLWNIGPGNYIAEQFRQFLSMFFVIAWMALLGVALVGVPIIFSLARIGRATVPWVLATSILASILFALLIERNSQHLGSAIASLVVSHLLLSISFCLAIGLPWRMAALSENSTA